MQQEIWKSISKQNMVLCRRGQNQLPQSRGNTNSRNADLQNFIQQCGINNGSKVHDNWHFKFLPQLPAPASRIHQNQDQWHPTRNYQGIQTLRKSHIKQPHLHQGFKGMYGLPQTGLIANKLLEKQLSKQGYWKSKLVPGLWKHDMRPIQFTLVVDNFRIK